MGTSDVANKDNMNPHEVEYESLVNHDASDREMSIERVIVDSLADHSHARNFLPG